MRVLVLNCGSSSVKYQLVNMDGEQVLAKGLVEKISLGNSEMCHKRFDGHELNIEKEIPDHTTAIELVIDTLLSPEHGVIKDKKEIDAVGHRVVHGGEEFSGSVAITPEVMKVLEDCIALAPLHNPPNIKGILATMKVLPDAPQCGVFDTAFHQTMPDFAYMYALPKILYKKYGVRRYGFHGTSHRYVADRVSSLMNIPYDKMRIITCHLGNGSSIAAVKNGKSVDTSMGFTPVEGLVMGTRCGDIDPAILLHVMEKEELTLSQANSMLNKHSGLYALSDGISSDMRAIYNEGEWKKDPIRRIAMEVTAYRIKKYIGAYTAAMGGLDAVVFTAGIGENAFYLRELSCQDLEFLGIKIDPAKNFNASFMGEWKGQEKAITTDSSTVQVWVIPTNEELVIARDTAEIVQKQRK